MYANKFEFIASTVYGLSIIFIVTFLLGALEIFLYKRFLSDSDDEPDEFDPEQDDYKE